MEYALDKMCGTGSVTGGVGNSLSVKCYKYLYVCKNYGPCVGTIYDCPVTDLIHHSHSSHRRRQGAGKAGDS
jgi:hypothetical protein